MEVRSRGSIGIQRRSRLESRGLVELTTPKRPLTRGKCDRLSLFSHPAVLRRYSAPIRGSRSKRLKLAYKRLQDPKGEPTSAYQSYRVLVMLYVRASGSFAGDPWIGVCKVVQLVFIIKRNHLPTHCRIPPINRTDSYMVALQGSLYLRFLNSTLHEQPIHPSDHGSGTCQSSRFRILLTDFLQ